MLNKLTIRNFKRFDEVEIELGQPVVFIGPNNSGKTSAMQALALWDTGLRRWRTKHVGKSAPSKRPGATVNRKDTLAIPVPDANLMWRQLRTRIKQKKADGGQSMSNIRIEIIVDGVAQDKAWSCGLEFDYANAESFYCRPLRLNGGGQSDAKGSHPERMEVPAAAFQEQVAFLPPMSGLATTETRLDEGAVQVRVGEGRTAEVLRNLCYKVSNDTPDKWKNMVQQIDRLFGVQLDEPLYIQERGEIVMGYREQGVQLDLCASGRGLQQTLLILSYMYAHPGAVILLDEPDAHLEILRQRQIYKLLCDTAEASGSQVIAASHSEVLLNEAAGKDLVIAFVGKPHRIEGGKSQVRQALAEVGFDQYAQAKQTGWVLYLEGSTDLAVLQAFARRLNHSAAQVLERPFVHYVADQPTQAKKHFYTLKEALPELKAVAVFDRLEKGKLPSAEGGLRCLEWQKREIENYICTKATLEAYAGASSKTAASPALMEEAQNDTKTPFQYSIDDPQPVFTKDKKEHRQQVMREVIDELVGAMQKLRKSSPWAAETKVSDEFLTPLFAAYFQKLELPNLMAKKNFYELANHVPVSETSPEIVEKLDAIVQVAQSAPS